MLEHNFEFGKIFAQRNELGVDEHGLSVKQVNVAAGDFAVHQQQHACFLHGFECFVGLAHVRHASIAVGGSASGIELGSDHACIFGSHDFVGRQVVGEVERHQWLKAHALRHGSQDALLVRKRLCSRGDGRLEVGHDDGTAKLGGGVRNHGIQCSAVTDVKVPIVGSCDGDFLRHALIVDEVGVISGLAAGEGRGQAPHAGVPEIVTPHIPSPRHKEKAPRKRGALRMKAPHERGSMNDQCCKILFKNSLVRG